MGSKKYDKRGPGGAKPPPKPRGSYGSHRPPGGGGGGGTGSGSRHKGGTSSSSVHDSIRILVVGMAALALLLVGTPVAYLTWSAVSGS